MNDPSSFRAPGGESFQELRTRFVDCLEDIARGEDGNILAITHSGVVKVAILVFTERPLSEFRRLPPIPEGSITTVDRKNGKWLVGEVGQAAHLREVS